MYEIKNEFNYENNIKTYFREIIIPSNKKQKANLRNLQKKVQYEINYCLKINIL